MKLLARTLPPFTLFEWGAILSYFYFSGRLAAFLHPMFRPLVLITGLLLTVTAVCVAFFPEEECAHGHDDGSAHDHHAFSAKSLIAFLILLLPLALAAVVSPDDYGTTIIKNRGLVEDIRSLPGIAKKEKVESPPVLHNEIVSANAAARAQQSQQLVQMINAAGRELARHPGSTTGPKSTPAPALPGAEPPLPASDPAENEDGTTTAQVGDATVTYQNDFRKPDKQGNIKAQVTDLLYAAQEPGTRKDFEGKRVELIGQFVGEKSAGKQRAGKDAGSFHLLRLVMVCCAADMMPAAVKVQPTTKFARTKEMAWLKVTGVCHFRPRAKPVGDDGIDYGNYPEPVIVADQVATIKAPREKFIY